MATKTKTFSIFGVEYRTTQFPAIQALEIMGLSGQAHPLDNLRLTSVKVDGQWTPLDGREAVNALVVDRAGILPPRMVLQAILKLVNEFSFGFTAKWRGTKIPKRFTSEADVRQSSHVDPLIAHLLQEEAATMRELEEYYSLEDAFKMFDVMVVKGVNTALAHEAASKAAQRR